MQETADGHYMVLKWELIKMVREAAPSLGLTEAKEWVEAYLLAGSLTPEERHAVETVKSILIRPSSGLIVRRILGLWT
jgi:hypothetical protein